MVFTFDVTAHPLLRKLDQESVTLCNTVKRKQWSYFLFVLCLCLCFSLWHVERPLIVSYCNILWQCLVGSRVGCLLCELSAPHSFLPLGDRFFTALTLLPLLCDLVWSRVSLSGCPAFFLSFFFLPFHPSAHPACDLFPPQRPSRPSSKHASASTSPSTSRSSLPLPSSGETRLVDFPPGMETLEKI